MIYPLSASVAVGDATEAAQYNNLRTDALYLGENAGVSGSVRDLVICGSGNISLQRASGTRLSVPASASVPAAAPIDGQIAAISAGIGIDVDPVSWPDAAELYVLAVKSASSAAFSLAISASASAAVGSRLIGRFLWTGSQIVQGSVLSVDQWQNQKNVSRPGACDGRLTLVSGQPVPENDVEYASILYFSPYQGNSLTLNIGGVWEPFSFSELHLDLSGIAAGSVCDIFVGLNATASGLSLSFVSWGSLSTRPSGLLTRVDGVPVLASEHSKRYLGTLSTSADGISQDNPAARLLWNYNHRVARSLYSRLVTTLSSWYNTELLWMPYFGAEAPEVRIVLGSNDAEMNLRGQGGVDNLTDTSISSGQFNILGIGLDASNASPYTGNSNIDNASWINKNRTLEVQIHNQGAAMQGAHRYTLLAYSAPSRSQWQSEKYTTAYTASGAHVSLSGYVKC